MQDFITQYIDFASEGTESPRIFHRWSILTTLAAFLNRQYNIRHGHNVIQPNMYVMLIGSAGSRKSTSIKMAKDLLKRTGYTSFSSEKTTKEKFLMDLAGLDDSGRSTTKPIDLDTLLDSNIFGDPNEEANGTSEMFIAADEFNDFFGNDILGFLSMLGALWDKDGMYENKIKNGKSVLIPNPTINILGGNTPATFANTFPTEIFGQGFFSRVLLIYGERSDRRMAFPQSPDEERRTELLASLRTIRERSIGTIEPTGTSRKLLEKIYNLPSGFDDVRFESYGTRRFTHLLKLCLLVSASRAANSITEADVVYANTILSHAEQLMPKALGEFGRAKNADVTHKVMQIIYSSPGAVGFKEIWQQVGGKDIDNFDQLATIIKNLLMADKIQKVNDKGDLLPKRKIVSMDDASGTVDWDLLSGEERNMSK